MSKDQLYADIFTTAMEGGINDWAVTTAYHHRKPGTDEADLVGFGAMIVDTEDEDEPEYIIDRATIVDGVAKLAAATGVNPGSDYADWVATACVIVSRPDAYDVVDYDAGFADAVVQCALLGEVVYG